MGFTKIYKLTSPEAVTQIVATPNFNTLMDNNTALTYKDWTGTTHNGFIPAGYTGASSPYNNYIGRTTLAANNESNPFTLPSSIPSASPRPYLYFAIGSGTAAESEDDYHLASPLTVNTDFTFTLSAQTPTYDSGSNKTYRARTITITALQDISISEFGIYACIWKSRTSGTVLQWTPPVLMYRKVLTTPISLSAGQSVTIDWRLSGG